MSSQEQEHASTANGANGFDDKGHKIDFTSGMMNFDVEAGEERRSTMKSIEMLALVADNGTTSTMKRQLIFPVERNNRHETTCSMGGLNRECFDVSDDDSASA
jgi:hypothetical protein